MRFNENRTSPARNMFRTIVYSKYPSKSRMLFSVCVLKHVGCELHAGSFDQRGTDSDRLSARECWVAMYGAHIGIASHKPNVAIDAKAGLPELLKRSSGLRRRLRADFQGTSWGPRGVFLR